MPKGYKIVRVPNSFTWKYQNTDTKPPTLEESRNSWATKQEVRDAIKAMKEAEIVEEE
jgi:hypothetical protein